MRFAFPGVSRFSVPSSASVLSVSKVLPQGRMAELPSRFSRATHSRSVSDCVAQLRGGFGAPASGRHAAFRGWTLALIFGPMVWSASRRS